ncbi:hypothetical protein [Microbacterium sp. SSM24]|uniref:hypothetical protein n=1 Tax=Microbacterium sp. SSM24 TaxID=2991714 RepID=UPI0022276444|nr:hypothetical protein [Microbacterium sp. SSM24]MCW3493354.1 hypothetical protein [Microbacterium sp. SSM24]
MSNSYETSSNGSGTLPADTSGKVEAVKQEASDLKDTAEAQAKDVLGTAKEEAATVVGEAKSQGKDLLAQTQRELKEQADTQQKRLAGGLRSVGDELGEMARASDGRGVAGDLVQQASTRLSAAASWLGDRDPAAVLTEVKRFARRKPGTFILAAAVTGIVVGRLTRALAANAADDRASTEARPTSPAPAPELRTSPPATVMPVSSPSNGEDAPLYAQTASSTAGHHGEDGHDDRHHTV